MAWVEKKQTDKQTNKNKKMCCKLESWVANQHLEIGTEKKKVAKKRFFA